MVSLFAKCLLIAWFSHEAPRFLSRGWGGPLRDAAAQL